MPALGDRLAVVKRFELGQLVDVLLDQVGELVHQASAVASIRFAPGARIKSLAGGLDGEVDVGGVPFGDLGDDLFGGRVIVSNVLPLLLSRHLPSIRSLVWSERATLRFGAVAVAMRHSPFVELGDPCRRLSVPFLKDQPTS